MGLEISNSLIRNSGKYFVLLAAVFGLIYFYKYKDTFLRPMMYLLWTIAFVEFFSYFTKKYGVLVYTDENGVPYTYWLYNLLYFGLFLTVFRIYLKAITNKVYKKWIRYFIISYILISIVNWTMIQNFVLELSVLPYISGSIFLIITIIFYFLELLKSEKILLYHRQLLFWISIGLLLFHTGTIPFSLEINGYALIPGIHKLFLIITFLSNIMYSMFTFGFIWSRKE